MNPKLSQMKLQEVQSQKRPILFFSFILKLTRWRFFFFQYQAIHILGMKDLLWDGRSFFFLIVKIRQNSFFLPPNLEFR